MSEVSMQKKPSDLEIECRDKAFERILEEFPDLKDVDVRIHPNSFKGDSSYPLKQALIPLGRDGAYVDLSHTDDPKLKELFNVAASKALNVYRDELAKAGFYDYPKRPENTPESNSQTEGSQRDIAFSCLGITVQVPAFLANLFKNNPR
jgi:hypothetical protein